MSSLWGIRQWKDCRWCLKDREKEREVKKQRKISLFVVIRVLRLDESKNQGENCLSLKEFRADVFGKLRVGQAIVPILRPSPKQSTSKSLFFSFLFLFSLQGIILLRVLIIKFFLKWTKFNFIKRYVFPSHHNF